MEHEPKRAEGPQQEAARRAQTQKQERPRSGRGAASALESLRRQEQQSLRWLRQANARE
jgi:hypothetical protein